jgi:uncharacterized protein (DUF1330 family)
MAAYVIVNVRVHDPELFARYAAGTLAAIERHGGRYLARGGPVEVREGSWEPERLVILEFPDADAARAWYESDEYQELLAIRQRAAEAELVIAEGLSA